MFDVHIIGAGPTGSISAISAIRNHNASVYLSEEHKKAGTPLRCSGLFSIKGLDSMQEFLEYRKTVINKIRGAVIDIAGVKLDITAKNDVTCICNRAEFDAILAANAESEGAKIFYGERTKSNFKSNNIIGADGPHSLIASYFNFPHIEKFVSTLQANIKYRAEDPHKVEIFLLNSKFPGFFGWIIPHSEEEAEFGCGVSLPNNSMAAFEALLRMKGIRKKVKPKGAVIPIQMRAKTAIKEKGRNVILVGDAAGQAKATTGGGVIFGGQCAKLAGKYFFNPLRYEFEWKKSFWLDLFLHSQIQQYLSAKSDLELQKLGTRLKTSGLETYLSEKGDMDKPSRMISFELLNILPKIV